MQLTSQSIPLYTQPEPRSLQAKSTDTYCPLRAVHAARRPRLPDSLQSIEQADNTRNEEETILVTLEDPELRFAPLEAPSLP